MGCFAVVWMITSWGLNTVRFFRSRDKPVACCACSTLSIENAGSYNRLNNSNCQRFRFLCRSLWYFHVPTVDAHNDTSLALLIPSHRSA